MKGSFELAVHLFLQLTVILATCRLVSAILCRYFGQTRVVGEMVAGVLLGPSLLGLLAPEAQQWLFPTVVTLPNGSRHVHPSMTILYALSQVGLVLYMFLIGLELNRSLLVRHSRKALFISGAGILVPALMGGAQGYWFAANPDLFAAGLQPWQSALFLGSAMSITAFPMLSRILQEQGLSRTRFGTLALGAAASNDAFAWCLLACVLASTHGSPTPALLAIGGGAGYALAMATVGRTWLTRLGQSVERAGDLAPDRLALVAMTLCGCAWLTDLLGIYSVFGAFVLGAVMPRGVLGRALQRAFEGTTVALLLPVFFVYSGLSTQVSLILEPRLSGTAGMVLLTAFACKGLGCSLAGRYCGASWREASAMGALMNARGMMELILLNIALEKGLITPALFTILVLMAVVTTLATSPIFRLLYGRGDHRAELLADESRESGQVQSGAAAEPSV